MKSRGCTSYLNEDRNRDLLRTYNRIMRRSGSSSFSDVYEEMKRAEASRFWCTWKTAYEHIVRKSRKDKEYEGRSEMYDEIEKRATEYADANKCSFRLACKAVVMQPAPSFYLSVGRMKNIIRRMLKRKPREE